MENLRIPRVTQINRTFKTSVDTWNFIELITELNTGSLGFLLQVKLPDTIKNMHIWSFKTIFFLIVWNPDQISNHLISCPCYNSLINMRLKDFFTEDLTYYISVSTVLFSTPAKSHSLRTHINIFTFRTLSASVSFAPLNCIASSCCTLEATKRYLKLWCIWQLLGQHCWRKPK